MAKYYIQRGETMRYTAAAVLASGYPVSVGALVGVTLSDMAIGDTDELGMDGVFAFTKRSGLVLSQGDLVEWDNGISEVVPDADAAGDFDLGYVWKDAAAGDAQVEVRLLRP